MHASTTHPELTEADRAWFGERVDALLPELFGAAVRLCRNRANAEDLVAESVGRAWSRLHTLRDRASFRAWIFRILNNTFVSDCRSADASAVHQPLDTTGDEPFSLFERLHAPILLCSLLRLSNGERGSGGAPLGGAPREASRRKTRRVRPLAEKPAT